MKIFFVETQFGHITKKYYPNGVRNFLISYWYDNKASHYKKFKEDFPDCSLLVDSGAFTADTKGVKIDIDEYVEFCLEIQDYVDHIITLDVIGDAEKSKINYDYMIKKGVKKLMPAYHSGEDYKYLEYYCKQSDYIGVGALVGMHLKQRQLFNFIRNITERVPKDVKIHLLGVSSPNLLYRFADRVFSVDSSSISTKSAYSNRTLTLTGMPKGLNKGFPQDARIATEQVWELHKLSIMSQLRLEREINDYLEHKSIG